MGDGGQRHAPAALPQERDPVPIVQEAGFALRPVWMGAKNLALTGVRSPDRPDGSEVLNRSLLRLLILFCAAISGEKKPRLIFWRLQRCTDCFGYTLCNMTGYLLMINQV